MFEDNRRGQLILIELLWLLITVVAVISLIPAFNMMLNLAQQSDYLNCNGYYYNGDVNNTFSYNASLPSNTLACLAIRLYLPYILLIVMVATISKVVSGRLSPTSGGGY